MRVGDFAKLVGGSVRFHVDRFHNLGTDLEILREVSVFHGRGNDGGELRFAGYIDPDEKGRDQREQLPADVIGNEMHQSRTWTSSSLGARVAAGAEGSKRFLRAAPKC